MESALTRAAIVEPGFLLDDLPCVGLISGSDAEFLTRRKLSGLMKGLFVV